ncbi:MAG: hypothetical protein IPK88_03710 [Saprospiraceae bacterium]|nr:hypothetical protein [Candidatus Defluviibacterium haderslevense]MCI1265226.1 hypothetical protein [Saprospiraceae bacterium]
MKLFSLFFALYFFGLTLMPCGDEYDCNQVTLNSDINNSDHEKHNHESENCSPFCFCSCCGSVYTHIYIPIYIPIRKVELSETICEYKNGYIQNIYFNIWQPPKIS